MKNKLRIYSILIVLWASQAFAQLQSYWPPKTHRQLAGSPSATFRADSLIFGAYVIIDSLIVATKNAGVLSSNFGTLAAAINAAEADTAHVVVPPKRFTLTATDTLHKTAAMYAQRGARISIGAGVTFLIQGHFYAGTYQVFEGSGSVVFADGSVDYIRPEWWGANSNDSADDASYIRKAIRAGRDEGIPIQFSSGIYIANTYIDTVYSSNIRSLILQGENALATIIRVDTALTVPLLTIQPNNGSSHNRTYFTGVRNLSIQGQNRTEKFDVIYADNGSLVRVENCYFYNIGGTVVHFRETWDSWIINNTFESTGDSATSKPTLKFTYSDVSDAENGNSNNIMIMNNQFEAGYYYDIFLDKNTKHCRILGNKFHGAQPTTIDVHHIFADSARNNVIDGNMFGKTDSNAVVLTNGSNSNVIVGNKIASCKVGVDLRSGSNNNIIVGNMFGDADAGVSVADIKIGTNVFHTIINSNQTTSSTHISSVAGGKYWHQSTNAKWHSEVANIGQATETWQFTAEQAGKVFTFYNDAQTKNGDVTLGYLRPDSIGIGVKSDQSKVVIRATANGTNNLLRLESRPSIGIPFDNSLLQAVNVDGRGNLYASGSITFSQQDTTEGSEDSDMIFKVVKGAAEYESMRLQGSSGATIIQKINVDDTTGVVLSTLGAATVSVSNLILDTFGGVAADTAVTLTGTIGDIVYISSRNANRDITFLDAGNFSLGAERVLTDPADVLVIKATTTTAWKEIGFFNNN